MREAVIVSTARTPLTKAHRGEFNITPGPTLAAFAVKADHGFAHGGSPFLLSSRRSCSGCRNFCRA